MKYYCKKKKTNQELFAEFLCNKGSVWSYYDAHFSDSLAGDNHVGGNSREGAFKETVTLKWCTPRTNSVGR